MEVSLYVSLVITTYNSPEFLELVLKSILRQKRMPLEIIIADDGSGDATRDLINRYRLQFKVPLIHSWIEDRGFRVAKSRNMAIAKARGEYIVILDGDMVVGPHFIADHEALREKDYFVAGSRARLSESATARRKKSLNPVFHFFSKGLSRRFVMLRIPWLKGWIRGREGLAHARSCHMAFWKADFIRVNGFEENFVGWGFEDSEFIQRLYNVGVKRRNAKLMAPAVHLYHPEKRDDQTAVNWKQLQDAIRNKKIEAAVGVKQYLEDSPE